jgi:hypothetical protein
MVALVLNFLTSTITPQFHVVFDDMFSTVTSNENDPPEIWGRLIDCASCRLNALVDDDDDDVEIHDEWLTVDERLEREHSRRQQAVTLRRETNLRPTQQNHDIGDAIERANTEAQAMSPVQPRTKLEIPQQVQFGSNRMVVIDDSLPTNRANRLQTSILRTPVEPPVPRTSVIAHEDRQVIPEAPIGQTGRPTRQRTPTVRYDPGDFRDESAGKWKNNKVAMMADAISGYQAWKDEDLTEIYGLLGAELDADQPAEFFQPKAYVSKKVSDPDTPTYREAVFSENGEEYWKGMKGEIEALTKHQTWEVLPRISVPKGEVVVPGTWAFRCKRRPDGSFRKFKSRWCVRGNVEARMSEGKMNTYSPVIQWSSVRLMLIFTILFDLRTQSTDFSNAFAQADMPDDLNIYLEMPENFGCSDGSDSVLKLKKSLYGSTVAPRLWYEKLKGGLIDRGFAMCTADPCSMFIRKDCIVQLYIDDVIWYSQRQSTM